MESKIKIVNVVISSWTNLPLSIIKLATTLPKSIYEPDNFSGLVYHRQVPKATIIMFASGRMVSTGSNSEKIAIESLIVTSSELSKILEKNISIREFKIENVVATSKMNFKINLTKFAKNKGVKYNPKEFPACFYAAIKNTKILIFSNGKMVSVGGKSEEMAKLGIVKAIKEIERRNCLQKLDI